VNHQILVQGHRFLVALECCLESLGARQAGVAVPLLAEALAHLRDVDKCVTRSVDRNRGVRPEVHAALEAHVALIILPSHAASRCVNRKTPVASAAGFVCRLVESPGVAGEYASCDRSTVLPTRSASQAASPE
jgi:hypothetical protein